MTTILNRLPFHRVESTVACPNGPVIVRPFQIVVWVSLTARGVFDLPPAAQPLPAVLDTGLNHNFAIREAHLTDWVGMAVVRPVGWLYMGNHAVPLMHATLWIHANQPGERDALTGRAARLECQDGIAVYPRATANPARLPTLGLRALVNNRLRLLIDGARREVGLEC